MVSTSLSCPTARAEKRRDLKIRPLPEIGTCMVYRPRPARIISLNLGAWLLLEMCDGSKVSDVLAGYLAMLEGRGRQARVEEVEKGLRSLIDNELITIA
jgi:hypothetical protein